MEDTAEPRSFPLPPFEPDRQPGEFSKGKLINIVRKVVGMKRMMSRMK